MCFMKTTTDGQMHDERIAALQMLSDPHPVGASVHHMVDNPGIDGSGASPCCTCKAPFQVLYENIPQGI